MPRSSHYGKPGSTIAGPERAEIVRLIRDEKLPRNEIAKRVGRSGSTISGIAKAEGLEFGQRSKVAAATQARTIDNRKHRAEVSARLLTKAGELLDEIDKPFLAFNIGGKDNVYTEHRLAHAPTGDKKNLVQAAATALREHRELERHDADSAAADARSMLAALGRALGVQQPDA